MSYSFSVQAATKDEAKAAAAKAFEDVVVKNQPIHARDRDAAIANINAVIDLLVDDPSKHISVSANGYVSWIDSLRPDGSNSLTTASVSANASLIAPPV